MKGGAFCLSPFQPLQSKEVIKAKNGPKHIISSTVTPDLPMSQHSCFNKLTGDEGVEGVFWGWGYLIGSSVIVAGIQQGVFSVFWCQNTVGGPAADPPRQRWRAKSFLCILLRIRGGKLKGVSWGCFEGLGLFCWYPGVYSLLSPPLVTHHSLLCGYRCLVTMMPSRCMATTTREHGDIANDLPKIRGITCTQDMVATSYWCRCVS